MAVRALDHVNIGTDRLAETRDFFVDVLGLVEGPRPSIQSKGHWLYAGDKAVVHLIERPGPMASLEGAIVDHFALEVTEIQAFAERLQAMGLPFRENRVESISLRQIVVHDPNGVKVELNCREPA